MKSNCLRILILGLTLGFLSHSTIQAQQLRIAAVDMAKIFQEYYKTKKADAELKDRAEGYQKELKAKDDERQKLFEEGNRLEQDANNPAFTEEKKSETRRKLEAAKSKYRQIIQELNDMKQLRTRELKENELKVRNAIVDDITKTIQEKARKDGFSLVIDKTGQTLSGVPPFIYIQDSMDITGDVIRLLNAGAPDKAKDAKK